MKPSQSFLFLVAVLAALALISIVFPKEGIPLGGGLSLQFESWEEFTRREEKDISGMVALSEALEEEEVARIAAARDSALVEGRVVYFRPVSLPVDSVVQPLEFPGGDPSILESIFAVLAELPNTGDLIHIMHFGDSQIEADRITSYFRYRLQTQFGGHGTGMVPAVQAYQFALPITPSPRGDWRRHTIYAQPRTELPHKRYGPIAGFTRFAPVRWPPVPMQAPDTASFGDSIRILAQMDSVRQDRSGTVYSASVSFGRPGYGYDVSKEYYRCRMLYGHNQAPVEVQAWVDGELFRVDTLQPSDAPLESLAWSFERSPGTLELRFAGKDSPDVYGFSFEDHVGVCVDNIAMRGNSGTIFTSMDMGHLQAAFRMLNLKLLILQFGGNVVPYGNGVYTHYSGWLESQFSALRRIMPDVPIIVIGPGDMSEKDKDSYVTHRNLVPVRDAVKQAAFRSGCAYWDMFEAMGGQNSMPSWVFAEPSLAERDFIHFNPRGANVIARMFYSAFISEYNRYVENHYQDSRK